MIYDGRSWYLVARKIRQSHLKFSSPMQLCSPRSWQRWQIQGCFSSPLSVWGRSISWSDRAPRKRSPAPPASSPRAGWPPGGTFSGTGLWNKFKGSRFWLWNPKTSSFLWGTFMIRIPGCRLPTHLNCAPTLHHPCRMTVTLSQVWNYPWSHPWTQIAQNSSIMYDTYMCDFNKLRNTYLLWAKKV